MGIHSNNYIYVKYLELKHPYNMAENKNKSNSTSSTPHKTIKKVSDGKKSTNSRSTNRGRLDEGTGPRSPKK